ncbi:MAG: DUF3052 domain-containing protein [Acidobacteriota bacterium]
MAGYSSTPLPKKLGIKGGHRVALVSAPKGFAVVLGVLPAGARIVKSPAGGADVVLVFAGSRAALAEGFPRGAGAIPADGAVWACWPKKSSGVATDLVENDVRAFGLGLGLVDVKVCAVDETWSGLKFVVRLSDRPRWTRRTKPG